MQRAIAKQAEAERERRSRIIIADGELEASLKMSQAAKLYEGNPMAIRLREFQTLTEVAREKNLVVVTPTSLGSDYATLLGMMKKEEARAR